MAFSFELLQNKLNRYFFLAFKICTQLWVCLFALSWKIISDFAFFDAEESIDPRSETRFWFSQKNAPLDTLGHLCAH